MVMWKDVLEIYKKYQEAKGPFRRFFNSNSPFMTYLSNLLKNKNLQDTVDENDQFDLVYKVIELSKDKEGSNSYKFGTQMINLFIEDKSSGLYFLFQFLYHENVFDKFVFNSIMAHQDRLIAIRDLLSLINLGDDPESIAFFSRLKFFPLEDCLARLFLFNNNPEKALFWFRQAINNKQLIDVDTLQESDITANVLYALAQNYEHGETIPKEITEAIKLYTRAMELNHVQASLRLGELYQIEDDSQIKPDITKAFECYLCAAKLGAKQAMAPLKRLAEYSTDLSNRISNHRFTLWSNTEISIENIPLSEPENKNVKMV